MFDYNVPRKDLKNDYFDACFGGGIVPALMDSLSVENKCLDEHVRVAQMWRIDIDRFTIRNGKKYVIMIITYSNRI